MNRRIQKGIRTAGGLAVALVLLVATATGVAFAETASGTTNITLFVSKTARFGESVRLSARLLDAAGAPIGGARVAFVAPEKFFLGASSDVPIAEVLTNKEGVAEAEYQVRSAGWLEVRADFRGNDRFAASRATGRMLVDEVPRQLYIERAGVQIPGLNAPPLPSTHAEGDVSEAVPPPAGLTALWPTLSVWPLALVLLIVWSLYGIAVRQMFRIASTSGAELAHVRAGGHGGRRIISGGSEGALAQSGVPDLPQNRGEGQ